MPRASTTPARPVPRESDSRDQSSWRTVRSRPRRFPNRCARWSDSLVRFLRKSPCWRRFTRVAGTATADSVPAGLSAGRTKNSPVAMTGAGWSVYDGLLPSLLRSGLAVRETKGRSPRPSHRGSHTGRIVCKWLSSLAKPERALRSRARDDQANACDCQVAFRLEVSRVP